MDGLSAQQLCCNLDPVSECNDLCGLDQRLLVVEESSISHEPPHREPAYNEETDVGLYGGYGMNG